MGKDYIDFKRWVNSTADEPLENMDAFFDARIDEYEDHMQSWGKHYKWLARLLPECIKTLLDLGCGSGLELDPIFARFPNLEVTGIDLSEKMLKKLQNKYSGRLLNIVNADYFQYNFGLNCFDAAVSFESLHHFTAQKKSELFSRLHRSLKPGGVYLECDYIATTQEIEDLAFLECRRRRARDNISSDTLVHFDTPLTLEHEISAIKSAGFSVVELVGYLPPDNHTPMIRAIK